MNNVFRLIWNRTLGRLVVTSEAARSRDKAATRQGLVGQLPAPQTSSSISALLRPAVIAVALAAGSLMLVAPEARADALMNANTCANNGFNNTRIGIGTNAEACEDGAVSIGWNSSAVGRINGGGTTQQGTSLGQAATSSGGVAIGFRANSVVPNGIATAIGAGSQATGNFSIAIGTHDHQRTTATADGAIALGSWAKSTALNAVAIGRQSEANSDRTVALGHKANAGGGDGSVAVGADSVSSGGGSVSVGLNSNSGTTAIELISQPLPLDVLQRGIAIGMNADGVGSVAIGHDAYAGLADGTGSPGRVGTALGAGTRAEGHRSIAIGTARNRVTTATGIQAIAMGNALEAKGINAIAIGNSAAPQADGTWLETTRHSANGNRSVSLGFSSQANSDDAIAVGSRAAAINANAIAIGRNAQAESRFSPPIAGPEFLMQSVALGAGAEATSGTAIGANAKVGDSTGGLVTGTAVGGGAQAGNAAIALSGAEYWPAKAEGNSSIAAGTNATTTLASTSAIALGATTLVDGKHSIAMGRQSQVSGERSIALGQDAKVGTYDTNGDAIGSANSAIALGDFALSQGEAAVSVGLQAKAYGPNSIAIGKEAVTGSAATAAGAVDNISIGTGATTGAFEVGANSGAQIALGRGAETKIYGAIAIGENANATTHQQSIALGSNATAASNSAVSIGRGASVTDGGDSLANQRGVALGVEAQADGNRATALGSETIATGYGALAVGGGRNVGTDQGAAKAEGNGAVAIGSHGTENENGALASADYALAMGAGSQATAENAIALGKNSLASLDNTIAMGTDAQATGKNAMALGSGSRATGSVAIGNDPTDPTVAANGGTAVGDGAQATWRVDNNNTDTTLLPTPYAEAGVALGKNALANRSGATALGTNTEVTAFGGVALGSGSKATVAANVAGYVPAGATATESANVAGTIATRAAVDIGSRQITSVAAGTELDDAVNVAQLRASETHYYSVNDDGTQQANFNNDGASGVNALAAGTNAIASGDRAVAVGDGADASSSTVTAGALTGVSNPNGYAAGDNLASTAVGAGAKVVSGTAIGFDAVAGKDVGGATENTGTAIGGGAQATGNASIAISPAAFAPAIAEGDTSIAQGLDARSSGISSVAIGARTSAAADGGIALGASAAVDSAANSGIALGNSANVTATSGMALGASSKANADAGIALGTAATVDSTATNGIALGLSSNVTAVNGVALGAGSAATVESGVAGYVPTGATAADSTNIAGTVAALGAVDIGSRQITSVAAGTELDDAVNVAQLVAVENIANTGWFLSENGELSPINIAPGDTADFTSLNSNHIEITRDGQSIQFDIGDAVVTSGDDLLAFAGDTGTPFNRKLGETTNVTGGVTDPALLSDNNIGVVADGTDTLQVKLAKSLTGLDEVAITDGPTINNTGIDMGGDKITNLAPGVAGTDAVNVNQLEAQKIRYYSVDDNGTQQGNFNNDGASGVNALAAGTNALAASDSSVAVGDGATTKVFGSGQVAIGNDATTFGQGDIAIGMNAQANGAGNVVIGDGAKASTVGESDGVALGKNADVTYDAGVALGSGSVANGSTLTAAAYVPTGATSVAADSAASEVSVGTSGSERRITNVAAGATDTDAVNVSQLKAVNELANSGWSLQANTELMSENIGPGETAIFAEGKNINVSRDANKITVATEDEVEFTQVTIGDATNNTVITSTVDGLDVGGDKITNVQAGDLSATSTDAVNGSQLFATNTYVANNTTNITNNAAEIDKGINFGDGATSNKYALGDTINVNGDANVTSTTTAGGVQLGLANVISVGSTNSISIDGDAGTISGLTNTTFDPNATYTGGQAATQEQLTSVSNVANAGWNVTDGTNT
ncbi:MAG: ESPR-type extended signal peptide-containing protein, partial [Pseudomonadota bacterium]